MPLPTIEQTWDIWPNIEFSTLGQGTEAGARTQSIALKNSLQDALLTARDGAITDQGGVPVANTFRYAAGTMGSFAGATDPQDKQTFDASDVGRDLEFIGGANAGNEGSFTITAVINSTTVEFVNPSGVADGAFTGYCRLRAGFLTTPITIKGSSAGSTGAGAGMDGKDRWQTINDLQSSTSTGGNRSWIVFQTTGGAEILFEHRTNVSSLDWVRNTITISPENGFTGGAVNAAPTATDQELHIDRNESMGFTGPGGRKLWFHVWMTTDGANFRIAHSGSDLTVMMVMVQQAFDPVDSPVIPWNGNKNMVDWSRSENGDLLTVGNYNDQSRFRAAVDKDASVGGPYLAQIRLTSEMAGSAMIGQFNNRTPNELSREWEMFSLGCVSTLAPVRGHMGRFPDMWYLFDSLSQNLREGARFPRGGPYTHVKIGHYVWPWGDFEYHYR